MLVRKLEAARWLDAAIELYLADGDPVAVATLVGAAHIVIIDLTEASKQQSILDRSIRPEHRWKTFENARREPQNFLKHAKTDPDGTYDLNPHETELLLFLDVLMSIELPTGRDASHDAVHDLCIRHRLGPATRSRMCRRRSLRNSPTSLRRRRTPFDPQHAASSR